MSRRFYRLLVAMLFVVVSGRFPVMAGERETDKPAVKGDHWAFKKITNPPVPKVDDKHTVQNPIDNFIIAKLSEKKLTPSPKADKHTLIRRVTIDVCGSFPGLGQNLVPCAGGIMGNYRYIEVFAGNGTSDVTEVPIQF